MKALFLVLALSLSTSPAFANRYFCVAGSSNGTSGFGRHDSKATATKKALDSCREHGGRGCRIESCRDRNQ